MSSKRPDPRSVRRTSQPAFRQPLRVSESYREQGPSVPLMERFEQLMHFVKWIGIVILAIKFIVTMYHIWH